MAGQALAFMFEGGKQVIIRAGSGIWSGILTLFGVGFAPTARMGVKKAIAANLILGTGGYVLNPEDEAEWLDNTFGEDTYARSFAQGTGDWLGGAMMIGGGIGLFRTGWVAGKAKVAVASLSTSLAAYRSIMGIEKGARATLTDDAAMAALGRLDEMLYKAGSGIGIGAGKATPQAIAAAQEAAVIRAITARPVVATKDALRSGATITAAADETSILGRILTRFFAQRSVIRDAAAKAPKSRAKNLESGQIEDHAHRMVTGFDARQQSYWRSFLHSAKERGRITPEQAVAVEMALGFAPEGTVRGMITTPQEQSRAIKLVKSKAGLASLVLAGLTGFGLWLEEDIAVDWFDYLVSTELPEDLAANRWGSFEGLDSQAVAEIAEGIYEKQEDNESLFSMIGADEQLTVQEFHVARRIVRTLDRAFGTSVSDVLKAMKAVNGSAEQYERLREIVRKRSL